MLELCVLLSFAALLIACLATGIPLVLALGGGFLLFFAYGLCRGQTWPAMLRLSLGGLRTVKTVAMTMLLVGILTALWRLDGTIAYIVYHLAACFSPAAVLVAVFLLCALISVLTGTAFGTAATMGVICMTITNSLQIDAIYAGGAILSGVYVGDRCSPVSTSALLVAAITGTDIFKNIAAMIRTSIVPLGLTLAAYALLGLWLHPGSVHVTAQALLAQWFDLHIVTVIPAALVIILSFCRLRVQYIMGASILTAAIIAGLIQGETLETILTTALWGFTPTNLELAALMQGGGIVSMVNVIAIICLSSTYAGMFSGTGLLQPLQRRITMLSQKITPFGTMCVTSVLTAMISCNQTLAIMLTHQLCQPIVRDKSTMAINLANSAVVMTPLIPWAIACSVVLDVVGAPMSAIVAACYLYVLPLCHYVVMRHQDRLHRVP